MKLNSIRSNTKQSDILVTQVKWKTLNIIAVIGLIIRVFYAYSSNEILHADEIMQYPEQAHRLVFGYGFIPWEFRYGIRSWALPIIISIPLKILSIIGIESPDIYIPIIRLIACIASCSLIYSCYFIARYFFFESTAWIACILVALWYELVIFSSRLTPETYGCYAILGSIALILYNPQKRDFIIAGLLIGLCFALRIQYAPVCLLCVLFIYKNTDKKNTLLVLLGITFSIFVIGLIDLSLWGNAVAPYIHNLEYNALKGVSSLFSVQHFTYYFKLMSLASLGIIPICFIFMLGRSIINYSEKANNWLLLSITSSVIILHSLVGHKEYRFIFVAIPVLLIISSYCVEKIYLALNITRFLVKPQYLLFVISTLGIFGALPGANQLYPGLPNRSSSLESTRILRNLTGVRAILRLDTSKARSGGYFYLHKRIPIYGRQDVKNLKKEEYSMYFSHIVKPISDPNPNGYTEIAIVGRLSILESKNNKSLVFSHHNYIQKNRKIESYIAPPKKISDFLNKQYWYHPK